MGKHYDVLSRRPSSLPLRLCAVFFAQSRPSCSFLEQSREVGVRSKLIRPGLTPEPTALEIGVQQTKTASGKLTITNKGYSAAQNVQVQLLTREGGAPPAWVSLASSPSIGALDIGQSTVIQVDARPGTDVNDGYYQLQLKISADNDPGGTVPVTIAVARDGQGGARFKLVDIYTNTLDAQGKPIEGLANARITLQNEALTADRRATSCRSRAIWARPTMAMTSSVD